MDTATKIGIAAKTVSKRLVRKTAEGTGNLTGNKMADNITSVGKSKKDDKTNKVEEIYIPPEKDNKLLMTWDYFNTKWSFHCIKMEFQKL